MTDCQCSEPGWCERHKVHKTPHLWHLCQTRENYWKAWERKRGPGQKPKKTNKPLRLRYGVGATLCKMLGCDGFRRSCTVNRWSPEKCLENLEQIITWIRAPRKNASISYDAARRLALIAIEKTLDAKQGLAKR